MITSVHIVIGLHNHKSHMHDCAVIRVLVADKRETYLLNYQISEFRVWITRKHVNRACRPDAIHIGNQIWATLVDSSRRLQDVESDKCRTEKYLVNLLWKRKRQK